MSKINRRNFLKLAGATATGAGLSRLGVSEAHYTYPEASSTVVEASHSGVWSGGSLVPEVLREMLDASITVLTGIEEPVEAWAELFAPDERIALKVNTIAAKTSHIPLVMAIADRLQSIGVPAEQIVIFDRQTYELQNTGFPVNRDGDDVRCYGTDDAYTPGWEVEGVDINLSDILLEADALINVPLLKLHGMTGISFALKNHYGTFSAPWKLHGSKKVKGLAGLNLLEPIREKTRLIVGDMLGICTRSWETEFQHDAILMSFDPVAHDTIGLRRFVEAFKMDRDMEPRNTVPMATSWLQAGQEMELGAHDEAFIDLVEVELG